MLKSGVYFNSTQSQIQIVIWGSQKSQLPRPEKAPNQKHEKRKKFGVISQPWNCVDWANIYILTSKLVWWFDVRKICMVPGDCNDYCPLRICWWWWLFIPIFDIFGGKSLPKTFVVMAKPEIILINMFSPSFVSNLMTLTWQQVQECQNW